MSKLVKDRVKTIKDGMERRPSQAARFVARRVAVSERGGEESPEAKQAKELQRMESRLAKDAVEKQESGATRASTKEPLKKDGAVREGGEASAGKASSSPDEPSPAASASANPETVTLAVDDSMRTSGLDMESMDQTVRKSGVDLDGMDDSDDDDDDEEYNADDFEDLDRPRYRDGYTPPEERDSLMALTMTAGVNFAHTGWGDSDEEDGDGDEWDEDGGDYVEELRHELEELEDRIDDAIENDDLELMQELREHQQDLREQLEEYEG